MRIAITGDTHGNMYELLNNCEMLNLKEEDYIIVSGDFGLMFLREHFRYKLSFLNKIKCTVLWVDGNHENHDWIDNCEVSTWCGGKVHHITKNCIHLMRGQVYTIGGKKFFTMGGGDSIDKYVRIPGVSWWEREMPSWEEENEALDNLAKHGNEVDYIITHVAPDNILYRINPTFIQDSLTHFLYEIEKKVEFKHWYFGHYHEDRDIDDKHTMLFNSVEEIK